MAEGKRGPNGGVIDLDDPVERLRPCRTCGQPITKQFPGRTTGDVGHHDARICMAAMGDAIRQLQEARYDDES